LFGLFIAAVAVRDVGQSCILASVPMSPGTVPATEQKVYVDLKDRVNGINQLRIACDFLDNVDSWDQMKTKLLDLPVGSTDDVLLELGIPISDHIPGSTGLSSCLKLLTTETEGSVQTKLNQREVPHFLDTHSSNACAKSACVSEPDDTRFNFNAKPDAVCSTAPMYLEIKSRVNNKGSAVVGDLANLDISNPTSNKRLTLTEAGLIEQMLQRVIQTAQFRAYLSRFIVLGSTGHWTFCCYYTQAFDGREERKLQIMVITPDTAADVWSSVCAKDAEYYLTAHGPLILSALREIDRALHPSIVSDLLLVRVHVAAVSRCTVYYVTPTAGISKKHMFAFKVVLDSSIC